MSVAANAPAESSSAAAWMYRGIWKMLVDIFRVPGDPPTLPVESGQFTQSFRPSQGFLRYMKFWFWLLLWPMDIAILIGWIAITVAVWWLGLLLLPAALALAILPDVIVYIGLHLRYDTTWYVMSDRSLRIRRGIWIIHETTITFENVQNLKVQQGPVQRHFGIANLIVETAGAGGDQHGKGRSMINNQGIIEGVANAHELRDRILVRMRESKSAGLGDESTMDARGQPNRELKWSPAHLQTLRDIRDEIRGMNRSLPPR
jgi:membrane protein YdbS with pleckstrin-like domain